MTRENGVVNIFVATLASIDMVNSVFVLPITIAFELNGRKTYFDPFCKGKFQPKQGRILYTTVSVTYGWARVVMRIR